MEKILVIFQDIIIITLYCNLKTNTENYFILTVDCALFYFTTIATTIFYYYSNPWKGLY